MLGAVNTTASRQPLVVLSFEVGGQRYGLLSSRVREIVRAVTIVPLPSGPSIVEGIIDVRGSIVPVVDIRSRFRLAPKPLEHTDHFVLALTGDRLVGLRVDRALDLLNLEADAIEDPRALVSGAEYIAGVAKLPDGLVLIHDLETFLSAAERADLEAAVSSLQKGATHA